MNDSNHKLRVAHIITQLDQGGAQRNTLYTMSNLDRKQYEPFLICGPGGMLDPKFIEGDWPTFYVPLVRPIRPIKDVIATIKIYKLLRDRKPHIVHTHSSKAGILGRLSAYAAGVPVIIHTFHGFGFNNRQKPWTRWVFLNLERFCAFLCQHLIFVSDENRKEADHLNIGRRIPQSLIRSGVQISNRLSKSELGPKHECRQEFQNEEEGRVVFNDSKSIREQLKIPIEAWVVCYVGNFKAQKNPEDLIQVAKHVLGAADNRIVFHFILVGNGKLAKRARELTDKLDIASRVHIPGWQRHDDVKRVLNESDSFLMTSLWEGLPRSLVEAYVASKPAVAYGVDGVRDILLDGKTGFLIHPGDTQLAADKILWLANHPLEAHEMGRKGHDLVIEEFDIDKMVREQEDLYQRLYAEVPLKKYYEPLWAPLPKPEE